MEYLRSYYLFPFLVTVGILAIILFLCWHFLKPEQKVVLYVAVIDDSLDQEEEKALVSRLQEVYHADGKKTVVRIDDSFYTNKDGISKLEVYLHSHQIDLIVADQSTFAELAGYGFFQDVRDVLENDTENALNSRGELFYTAGYKDTDEISMDDHETGQGECLPYGILLRNCQGYCQLQPKAANPVIGFAVDAPNQENAVTFLQMLEE